MGAALMNTAHRLKLKPIHSHTREKTHLYDLIPELFLILSFYLSRLDHYLMELP